MTGPLAVGLVGAGTWAARMHAPTLAAGPETRLAAVWARRADAARALVATLDTAEPVPVVATFDELVERCAAVAFAVPPDVQASLAVRAARAGRAVLLEKPIALDLAAATALAHAVETAGVVSQVVFTKRYHPRTRVPGRRPGVHHKRCPLLLPARRIPGGTVRGRLAAHPWRVVRPRPASPRPAGRRRRYHHRRPRHR